MNFVNLRGVLKQNYGLKHLTWFKTGGGADIFFKPEDVQDLAAMLRQNKGHLPVTVIGAGSNLIIRDKGIEGIVVKLGRNFTGIELVNEGLLAVQTGCLNFNLAKFCMQNSLAGFEFLIGIPGTIGGGIAMNAGAYGSEFQDIVVSVEALDGEGNFLNISNQEIGFSYRSNSLPEGLIFTRVFFKIGNKADPATIQAKMDHIANERGRSQPITEKTGGSTFANPSGHKAWQLIDETGLRGYKYGDACMSELHCNFMVNCGNATSSDLENLGELVRNKVREKTGIELKWEIKRVGRL